MASGILDLLGQAGTAIIVAPIVVLALDFLASGRLLAGCAFLGVVGLILVVERYVVTLGDVLERAVGGAVSAAVDPSDEE